MTFEDATTFEWADEAKTVVKRTTVDYPADLAELQEAIDEAAHRMIELPKPEPYPTQEEYDKKWADTENVCAAIDQKNLDDPDVQERLQLETSVVRWEQDIIDWRAKVGG